MNSAPQILLQLSNTYHLQTTKQKLRIQNNNNLKCSATLFFSLCSLPLPPPHFLFTFFQYHSNNKTIFFFGFL
ncbi:hypothetical protein RJT34_15536 [Clitoria ternatea]|uniref:Uncharacterized protein n=1 Tax=Clitoria ternatea TaxID=43366 RepID=A0AAN9PBI4_CLITE